MVQDSIKITDRIGERGRVEIEYGSVNEPLPFPVYCGACGVEMRFGHWYGGHRYRHPVTDWCPIPIRFSLRADFVARAACNAVTKLRGGDPNETVLDRLQHVDHVEGYYESDQWTALAILEDPVLPMEHDV